MHHPAEQPGGLAITRTDTDGIRVLALAGELDADNADMLREALRIDEDGHLLTVLDLGAVTFLDSSAISVLATARRNANAAGGWLRMAALTDPVERVIALVGLDTIIDCYPTVAEALKP
ncbi:STAS domain-containing protein [Streptomyces sp. NBC_00687]|uniref:STAS domain-containing protein n=1 Tax=Streptomyces sp. NBC_00687 TaxID=2975807 RepID=UPI0022568049|nr:STAS domain-containing protein [Streptomyces sp. NBC_00687]MCX4918986.1 STAS domain-containing protein [Streptomyces sp. NBC_00687]